MGKNATYHKKIFGILFVLVTVLIGGLLITPPTFAKIIDKVEIVMMDRHFKVVKGGVGTRNEFELSASMPTEITLRNEDSVAHEFMSTFFARVPVKLSGEASLVSTRNARGFRIDPGKSVVLKFLAPPNPDEGELRYDVFWCNVHGKRHGDEMRGEILTVPTSGGYVY